MAHVPCNPMASPGTRQSHFEDEALESIWEMREQDGMVLYDNLKNAMLSAERVGRKDNTERMEIMDGHGLYTQEDGELKLTADGESGHPRWSR